MSASATVPTGAAVSEVPQFQGGDRVTVIDLQSPFRLLTGTIERIGERVDLIHAEKRVRVGEQIISIPAGKSPYWKPEWPDRNICVLLDPRQKRNRSEKQHFSADQLKRVERKSKDEDDE